MIAFATSTEYVELSGLDNNELHDLLLKPWLHDLHNKQISNNLTNENRTMAIIEIFGGIDKIRMNYPIVRDTLAEDSEMAANFQSLKDQTLLYTFKANNSLLHHCLNSMQVQTTIKFVYSIFTIIFLCLLYVGMWIWWYVEPSVINDNNYFMYKATAYFISTIWQIMMILTVNVTVIKMVTGSFLFWFEIFLAFKWSILQFFMIYKFNMYGYHTHGIIGNILYCIRILLWVIMSCFIDGFHIKRKYKLIGMIAITAMFSVELFSNLKYSSLTSKSVIEIWSIKYSVFSGLIDAERTLLLFFFKRIMSLIRRGDKANNIKRAPYLQIIDSQVKYIQIDDILSYYLNPKNNIDLTNEQMKKIRHILISNEMKNASGTVTLHRKQINDCCTKIIFNKICGVFIGCIIIFDGINRLEFQVESKYWYHFNYCALTVAYFVLLCILLLGINIKAIALSMRTFVFWFKMYLAIKDFIYWLILMYYIKYTAYYEYNEEYDYNWIFSVLEYINVFLLVFYFSVMDGMITSRKAKICLSITICMAYTLRWIVHLISAPAIDSTIVTLRGGYKLSIYSEMISAEYSLCIFIFKQTVTLILNKNRCVNITQIPYIRWE